MPPEGRNRRRLRREPVSYLDISYVFFFWTLKLSQEKYFLASGFGLQYSPISLLFWTSPPLYHVLATLII